MKSLRLAAGLATIGLIGVLPGVAAAYPLDGDELELSDSTVAPGEEFVATLEDCTLGEDVLFTVAGDSATAVCEGTGGGERRAIAGPAAASASAELTAPLTPGEYPVTGTGQTSGVTDTAILTVVAPSEAGGELPATGSSNGRTMQIAGGVLGVGLLLLAVTWIRRRPAAA